MEARLDPRKAIEKDQILCLEWGGSFRQLTNTHLKRHGMTATEYKRKWGYRPHRFLACQDLLDRYAIRQKVRIATGKFTPHILTAEEGRRGSRARKSKAWEQLLTF
ncbi:MAG: MucR family transcriptional regulator [bacterium]